MGKPRLDGPSSGSMELSANYDMEVARVLNRTDHRTLEGNLYTYLDGESHTRFRVPLSWVSSMDRSLVNSWQEVGADLQFILDDDFPLSYHNVRIMGVEEPFTTSVAPYYLTQYAGEIILETI